MISDHERREAAARLRELAAQPDPDGDVYYGDLVDCGLLQWGTYSGHVTQESVEHLAALIDRPTTKLRAVSYWTACEACKKFFRTGQSGMRYCPYCGAEEVDDD